MRKDITTTNEHRDVESLVPVPQESSTESLARALLHPACGAGMTLGALPSVPSNTDRSGIAKELLAQIAAVKDGDLGRGEEMLVMQAHVLDNMFNAFAQLAMEKSMDIAEVLLPLALKAQNQCRATIEALDRIKNPRSYAVIHQANLANGPQQVNNNSAMERPQARRLEIENPPIKLSGGKQIGLLQDARAPAITSRTDSAVEAVAQIHGTKNVRG